MLDNIFSCATAGIALFPSGMQPTYDTAPISLAACNLLIA